MGTRLIVISGCIASGKSTVSRQLASHLRRAGRSAAVIDLDLIYEMFGDDPKSDARTWRTARQTAAALTSEMFSRVREFVIVEGDFWSGDTRSDFISELSPDTTLTFITLGVTFGEALRRTREDSTRGLSKDPIFLASHIASFEESMKTLPENETVIDSASMTVQQIVEIIVERAT